jgi:hypothetical protein
VRFAHDCFVGFGEAGIARLAGLGVTVLLFFPLCAAE